MPEAFLSKHGQQLELGRIKLVFTSIYKWLKSFPRLVYSDDVTFIWLLLFRLLWVYQLFLFAQGLVNSNLGVAMAHGKVFVD